MIHEAADKLLTSQSTTPLEDSAGSYDPQRFHDFLAAQKLQKQ